jgi:hypothetical protein
MAAACLLPSAAEGGRACVRGVCACAHPVGRARRAAIRRFSAPVVRRAESLLPSPLAKSQRCTATVYEEVPSRETNGRIHSRIKSAAGVKPRPPDAEHCSEPCARCASD